MSADAQRSAVLLTGHDAGRCARRVHNEWDPSIETTAWEVPADLQARFDAGLAFERQVFDRVRASAGTGVVDLSEVRGKAAAVADTVAALDDRVEVVLGGWLPDDAEGGRTGRPDVLLHVGDGRYVPGDVKGHKMLAARSRGVATCSPLDDLSNPLPLPGVGVRTSDRLKDYLQIAHYWRMLEAHDLTPDGAARGFVIGTDEPSDGWRATWLELDVPTFTTYSRSAGTARRSALERYDHEHGFRLTVAATAAAGEPAVVDPVFVDECRGCPWFDHCTSITDEDVASRQITSGRLDVREWTALAGLGVTRIEDLAELDVTDPGFTERYLPEVTHVKDALGRLTTARRRARMIRDGEVLQRETTGPVAVPRADVEIDLDIEWDPSDRVYLWGALVTGPDEAPTYHPVVTLDELDAEAERALARHLVDWLREQVAAAESDDRSLLVYHYAHPEPSYLKKILGEGDVADVLDRFVDLYTIVREHFFGVDGLGVKKVAPAFGFTWRDDDPGGLQSQLWLAEARSAADPETRRQLWARLLAYNEDDVRATHAIRNGL